MFKKGDELFTLLLFSLDWSVPCTRPQTEGNKSKDQQFISIIKFGPRPTYVHNSSFSPPADIMMMMVMIGGEIIIIVLFGLQIIIANWIATYNCKSDCSLQLQIELQLIIANRIANFNCKSDCKL